MKTNKNWVDSRWDKYVRGLRFCSFFYTAISGKRKWRNLASWKSFWHNYFLAHYWAKSVKSIQSSIVHCTYNKLGGKIQKIGWILAYFISDFFLQAGCHEMTGVPAIFLAVERGFKWNWYFAKRFAANVIYPYFVFVCTSAKKGSQQIWRKISKQPSKEINSDIIRLWADC